MRKLILNFALAGVLCSGSLMSCSSDDDSASVNNANITEVVNAAQNGTWRITSFIDSGNDETNHFTNYNFTFGNNGVLTAVNGDTTQTGTWSVTDDDSSDDDSPSNDVDFNIGFTSPADFADLTDDWDIVEVTAAKISLIDVSGGNGGTDTLVFEKNN